MAELATAPWSQEESLIVLGTDYVPLEFGLILVSPSVISNIAQGSRESVSEAQTSTDRVE